MVLIAEKPRMTSERRTQSRSDLRVPLFLLAPGWHAPIQTETENLSMDGFYCYAPKALAPGEHVRFLLFLPAATREPEGATTCIQGAAEVVRVATEASRTDFGIGCRVTNYRVLSNVDIRSDEVSSLLTEPLV